MSGNGKKGNKAAGFFGAGVCFLLAGIFNKDTLNIIMGCAWVCIGFMQMAKKRDFSDKD